MKETVIEIYTDLKNDKNALNIGIGVGATLMYILVLLFIPSDTPKEQVVNQSPLTKREAALILNNAERQAKILVESARREADAIRADNEAVLVVIRERREYERRLLQKKMRDLELDTFQKETDIKRQKAMIERGGK